MIKNLPDALVGEIVKMAAQGYHPEPDDMNEAYETGYHDGTVDFARKLLLIIDPPLVEAICVARNCPIPSLED